MNSKEVIAKTTTVTGPSFARMLRAIQPKSLDDIVRELQRQNEQAVSNFKHGGKGNAR